MRNRTETKREIDLTVFCRRMSQWGEVELDYIFMPSNCRNVQTRIARAVIGSITRPIPIASDSVLVNTI